MEPTGTLQPLDPIMSHFNPVHILISHLGSILTSSYFLCLRLPNTNVSSWDEWQDLSFLWSFKRPPSFLVYKTNIFVKLLKLINSVTFLIICSCNIIFHAHINQQKKYSFTIILNIWDEKIKDSKINGITLTSYFDNCLPRRHSMCMATSKLCEQKLYWLLIKHM